MKLALAQYRELESFAQFGSDLDAQTKKALDHGKKSVELLKQKQFSPVSLPKQVASIYALNNNLLTAIPTEKLQSWEQGFYSFLDASKSDLLTAIASSWGDETVDSLKQAIAEYNESFNA